jgi:hypothetical protein
VPLKDRNTDRRSYSLFNLFLLFFFFLLFFLFFFVGDFVGNAFDRLKLNVDFPTSGCRGLKPHENPLGVQFGPRRTGHALHHDLLSTVALAFEMQDMAPVSPQAKTRRRNLRHGLPIDENMKGPGLGVDTHRLPCRAAGEAPTRQHHEQPEPETRPRRTRERRKSQGPLLSPS